MPRRSMWIVVRPFVVAACLVAPAIAAPAAAPPAGPAAEVLSRLAAIAPTTRPTVDEAGRVTGIVIQDGSGITDDDAAILGRLDDLRILQIFDCRSIGDAAVAHLAGLRRLDTLALTNSGLTDAGVEALVQAFPDLVDLDLSSNTNMTGAALKPIAGLGRLERLSLLQNRFNDLHTRRLAKLQGLRTLDLRGNMEAGDMTLEVVGRLPALKGFKHRSTAVTDEGLDRLAASPSLEQLLLQDFAITNASGPHLARIATLSSLEIFRCQGFGSDGVLALGGLPLVRLTLRDLPDVDDRALAVLERLPRLRRLYLHELASVGDEGLRHLAAASQLEVLDVWSLPRMTDATVAVISALPNLRELSLRETGVTEAAVERIVAMPNLRSLVFKNNGPLSAANAARLAGRKWTKLETDAPR